MAASLEPVVEQPIVLADSGEFQRSASMCDAARFDLGRLRVLLLVDHVLVDAFVHQPMDLRLDPRLAKGRQVLPRIAVQQQLVLERGVDLGRRGFALRKLIPGQRRPELRRGIHIIGRCRLWFF